ncbi:hypothetical protein PROFUN_02647 [Planoprotostelium fungivorum]|uniref:CDC20/Fizzy WD40 domain-containing protein n=1 Tax=Planoprotostelium fungivorum TaxID=1890364 RepID=A0A2P6NVE9_9EUKA|nr:hypothetical protein PROFUN_02647 [Planoprotostelium fungivorum]
MNPSTPLKRSGNPLPSPRSAKTRKTPVSDRFIPSRANLSELDVCNFLLRNENTPNQHATQDTSSDKERYKQALSDQIFKGRVQPDSSKVLFFSPSSSSTSNTNAKEAPTTPICSVYRGKLTADKILDAPSLTNDYYLNLLDWSSQDVMSIALGDTVYLYSDKSATITPLQKHEDIITSVSFSADGRTLAVGTGDACIQLWDVEKQTMLSSTSDHAARVNALSWNGTLLSSASKDQTIITRDTRLRNPSISVMEGHTQEICGLKWSPNGMQLASGANDNTLKIWELRNSSAPRFDLKHHTAAVKAIDWCPWKTDLLASGGGTADRTIRFWNTQTGACLDRIDTKSQVCAVKWSTKSRRLVSSHGFSENQLIVWDYPSMKRVAELTGHEARVLYLALSPDGTRVVSGAADETLRIWTVFAEQKMNRVASSTRSPMKQLELR